MKKLLYLATIIGISSCTVSTPKLEGIWVNSYDQISHLKDWENHVLSTKILTIGKDSIQVQSFYAGYKNPSKTVTWAYKASKDSIWLKNDSISSGIHYSFDKDSLILDFIEERFSKNEELDTIRSVFFRYPTKTIKLDKLTGVYQWDNGYQSDTIELISDSLLLSNEHLSRAHKTYQTYWQTDNYIMLYHLGMSYPDMLFPISGNTNDFIAQSNYSKDLKFHFKRISQRPTEEVNIIGKWDLKEMQYVSNSGRNDTIINFKKNTTIEITKDSIFWGPSHYSYNWDYSKRYLLCNTISTDSDNEKWNEFITFKIVNILDGQLELERLNRGTIKYTLINRNGR